MKKYVPNPIDTSDVLLDEEIELLSEKLSKNTHEVWAKGRLDDGWIYGAVRNDEKKEHPCLIEYESLTEEEKDYDRRTAMETLKLIVKLGYEIKKKD